MPRTADRVKETTTTTGTGTLTLAGAVSQFQSFDTAFPDDPVEVEFATVGQTGTEWEVARGIFTAPSTLTRDVVIASSNAGALVSFSAGTKDVFATIPGPVIEAASIGSQTAFNKGWALP